MTLRDKSEIREVKGISPEEKQRILDFLQGAVYCWCKNRKNEWFSMRDLMGGENSSWDGTPLYALYLKHIKAGKSVEEAIESAGIDSGWLLKKMLDEDSRFFDTDPTLKERINRYKLS